MNIHEELIALTGRLRASGVDYALAGGLAVAVWGAPRYTADIDLLILELDLVRAKQIAGALGFDLVADPMDFSDGTRIRRVTKLLGGEALTLDLMLVTPNAGEWADRVEVPIGETSITVVSREALIRMKVRAGRQQDLLDVAKLQELDR
jgi:hypothetical protein